MAIQLIAKYGAGGAGDRVMKIRVLSDTIAAGNDPDYTPVLDGMSNIQDVAFTMATRWAGLQDTGISWTRFQARVIQVTTGVPMGLPIELTIPAITGTVTGSATALRGCVVNLHGTNEAGGNWRQDCYGATGPWDGIRNQEPLTDPGDFAGIKILVEYYAAIQLATITTRTEAFGALVPVVVIQPYIFANVNQYAHRHFSY